MRIKKKKDSKNLKRKKKVLLLLKLGKRIILSISRTREPHVWGARSLFLASNPSMDSTYNETIQYTKIRVILEGCATIFQEPNIINRCTDCCGSMVGIGERPQLYQRLVSRKASANSSMELGLEAWSLSSRSGSASNDCKILGKSCHVSLAFTFPFRLWIIYFLIFFLGGWGSGYELFNNFPFSS